jgi:hypothetical protein
MKLPYSYQFSCLKNGADLIILFSFKSVIPAEAGIQGCGCIFWIPVFTGMTEVEVSSKG